MPIVYNSCSNFGQPWTYWKPYLSLVYLLCYAVICLCDSKHHDGWAIKPTGYSSGLRRQALAKNVWRWLVSTHCRCFLQVIGTVQVVFANFVALLMKVLQKMIWMSMSSTCASSVRKNVIWCLFWNLVLIFLTLCSFIVLSPFPV